MPKIKQSTNLKTGYTTGTCAAAAAKSAMICLISGATNLLSITVNLPRSGHYGDTATIAVYKCGTSDDRVQGFSEIIKDAGDDPDVTNGAVIRADVYWNEAKNPAQKVEIYGGTGVGVVTRTGLPVAVGKSAINPVPCKMILNEVSEVLQTYNIDRCVKVMISVPDGEKIAKLTMNERLGIIGGISILGTRGVVIPFSNSAYRASLAVTIKAAAENGLRHVALTTGGRSEKYAMGIYPELDPMGFIEAGEFIGFSLKKCQSYQIQKVTISGMIGKLSKVASGVLMVHSSKSSIDFQFLAGIAVKAGAKTELAEKIKSANTAGEVAEWMITEGVTGFFDILTGLCCKVCSEKVQGQMEIETLLFNMDGQLLGRNFIPAK
ncbi:MAG: cobalt-precorrin-5B (C(1))-methyltransferase [Spirochaetia bacterium]|nr:cobalt-precorrin-5B (C(1))-methyltransferase [Spirochaetia bacterium]